MTLHRDTLHPDCVGRGVGIWLELKEDHRAGYVEQRICVHGVGTEIADSRNHRANGTLAEIGVGRADITMHEGRADRALGGRGQPAGGGTGLHARALEQHPARGNRLLDTLRFRWR